MFDGIWQDVRFAWRRLAWHPWSTALMVATLGIGIGTTTAIFSIVDQTILRPPPFAAADRLVTAYGQGGNTLRPERFPVWQRQPALFEAFEGYAPRQWDVTGEGEPERITGFAVTPQLFSMLGVQPALGRRFASGEGRAEAERVVVISDGLWRRRFAASRDVVGRDIDLNDRPHTIVGVMPRRFRLMTADEAAYVPVDGTNAGIETGAGGFFGVGRIPAGTSIEAAQARANVLAQALQQDMPVPQTWTLRLERKRIASVNDIARRSLLVLLGAVGFVLLISCTNVAQLLLASTIARERDFALRAALGGSRSRLIREVLAESLLLAAFAGGLGTLIASWGVDAVIAAAPANLMFMTTTSIEVDARVLVFTATIVIGTGILLGLLPAVRGSRPDLEQALRGSTQRAIRQHGFAAGSGLLVISSVGFSIVVLVGAGLMTRTMFRLYAIEPGFDPQNVVTFQMNLPNDRYSDPTHRAAMTSQVRDSISSLPGVAGTAVALGVPPGELAVTFGMPEAEGSVVALSENEIAANWVTADYFDVLRIPVLDGRTFRAQEPEDSIIVNRMLAERFWPDGSALGRRFRTGQEAPWATVVGIVGNVEARTRPDERSALQIYYPFYYGVDSRPGGAPSPVRRTYTRHVVLVRAANAAAVVPAIKARVWAVDPRQPLERIALLSDSYAGAFGRQRFVFLLMNTFGAIALILVATGLFGVLSRVVLHRTREVGIRVALGATPRDILHMILSHGMILALIGTVAGLVAAAGLSRVLTALLFEVAPYDPLSYAGVALLLLAVALLACWLPTRRAMRIEPAVALRGET